MKGSILLAPADESGCGLYRVMRPGSAYGSITNKRVISFGLAMPKFEWLEKFPVSMTITQRQTTPAQLAYWKELPLRFPKMKIVTDFDDLLWQPHPLSTFKPTKDWIKGLDEITRACNHITVSTIPLKNEVEKRYRMPARLLPNMVPDDQFFPIHFREKGEKLHIVYMGSKTHQADLEQIIGVVNQTSDKYKWTFIGYCPPEIKSLVNYIDWIPLSSYLMTIRGLKAHVGIAPLIESKFNECKSNIKLLEYGQIGLATIASNVYPYKDSGTFLVNKPRAKEWIKYLGELEDESVRIENARQAVLYAKSFSVKNREDDIIRAYM